MGGTVSRWATACQLCIVCAKQQTKKRQDKRAGPMTCCLPIQRKAKPGADASEIRNRLSSWSLLGMGKPADVTGSPEQRQTTQKASQLNADEPRNRAEAWEERWGKRV